MSDCSSSLLAHAADLLVLLDQRGRIREANPSLRATLGFPPATAHGQPALAHIHPDDTAAATAALNVACAGHIGQATVRARHADGTWRWIAARIVPLERQGRGVIAIVGRDLTTQKRLEADLLRIQRLDTVGRLTAGLLHDVNNMLTGIACSTTLARQAVSPAHPIQDDLAAIASATACAASCTRAALEVARAPSTAPGLLDLNRRIVDLERLLRTVLGPDIRLTTALAADLDRVRADWRQLAQVLINLALNARDAMPSGGALTITTAMMLTDGGSQLDDDSSPARYVVLTVCDTGIGMDDATQARLFEPFFTTKPAGHGTGLGLASCRAIVAELGGAIRITSAAGRGTTVSIALPLATDDSAATESSTGAIAGLNHY